jgi:chemotaxis protein MotB
MSSSTENQGSTMKKPPSRIAPVLAAVSLAGAGGLGYLGWQQHAELQRAHTELGRLRSENQGLSANVEQQRTSSAGLDGQLATCKDELDTEKNGRAEVDKRVNGIEVELSACQSSKKSLEEESAEAKARLAEFKDLTSKFQQMINAGKLDVGFRRGKMVVKLPATILFPSGSADFSDEGRVALGEVAAILKQVRNRHFFVAGHTDNVRLGKDDKFRSNWELSTARAVKVTELLIEKGVRPGNLVAAGYGEYDPVASNGTKTGRQKNRRIEIILEPELSKELAQAEHAMK